MDANLFLKRSILVTIACALPVFGSFAAGSSGGHSSGGSSGGGHSSNGSGGGHSSAGSNSANSANSSNSGHSTSTAKGSHAADPAAGPPITGTHPTTANPSSPARVKPVPVFNKQHFESGYGYNDLSKTDDQWQKEHRHLHHLFGFIPYWSSH